MLINGYEKGADISLLNVMYHKSKKDIETGKYGKDSLDIVFRDNVTGEKKFQHIVEPTYTYYKVKDGISVGKTSLLFIEKDKVDPITTKYKDLLKSIAENTGNIEFFYNNIRENNYKRNNDLYRNTDIFGADIHIEDYYRKLFNEQYKNEPYELKNLFFDIEVDISQIKGDFPEPGEAPINAVSLISEVDKTVYCLLLEDDPDDIDYNPLIKEFKNEKDLPLQIKQFVMENVGGWKQEKRNGLDEYSYKFLFYEEEITLIHDIFNIINILKPDFATAWNMGFDLPYIIARIERLGYDPADILCHPDFPVKEAFYYKDPRADKWSEKGDYAQISCYTVYIDQLITFASRRKGQRDEPSYKLDDIGKKYAKVRKLSYAHITRSLAELPFLNYKVFVFYNIMDTVVQKCIENKVKDFTFLYNKCIVNNTRYSKAHRQTTYLANRGVKEFLNMGYIMGNNVNKNNSKVGFVGAFVADPCNISDKPKMKVMGVPIMVLNNLIDFDYARLYPSIIFENNMSPNTMLFKLQMENQIDPRENRFNNPTFAREVWFIEDLVCRNYPEFGKRYLNLAGYEELFDDIIEYFSIVKNPIKGTRIHDSITGMRYMTNTINNDIGRTMCYISTEPREMCIITEKMPGGDINYDNK